MENSENKYSFNPEILAALIENGPDYMTELFRIGMNAAMRLERDSFLNAGPYERKPQRIGYANGFKSKTFSTRSGPVTFAIPQDTDVQLHRAAEQGDKEKDEGRGNFPERGLVRKARGRHSDGEA